MGGREGKVAACGAENLGLGIKRALQGPSIREVRGLAVSWWWDKPVRDLGTPDKPCSEALQTYVLKRRRR